jgi:hypothetical protein
MVSSTGRVAGSMATILSKLHPDVNILIGCRNR